MTDVNEQMAKLPHPFVNGAKMAQMVDQLVALVGKVDRVEQGAFVLRTTDGKYLLLGHSRESHVDIIGRRAISKKGRAQKSRSSVFTDMRL